MANRKRVVAEVLQRLGIQPPYNNSFEQRLRVQKTIYLAQVSLLKDSYTFDYRFTWYAHGPYCTTLAHDYYHMTQEDLMRVPLPDDALPALARVTSLMTPPRSVDLSQTKWLELVASWRYHLGSRQDKSASPENRRSFRKVKRFSDAQIDAAHAALRKAGLV